MKTYLTAFTLFFIFSLNIFADYPYIRFEGHTGKVDSIALSSDGNTIASGGWDKTVRLWDIAAEEEIVTLTGHTGPVYAVAFSRDGKMLASGSYDRTIRLWDVETHTNIGILAEHKDAVSSLVFSRDGKTLISGSYDHTIRLWDIETKTNIKTLTEHKGRVTSVVLSPDGKMFASSSWDKTVRLWDVVTHTNITTFTEHTGDVMSVAFSPDGKTIAYGNQSGNIILWEIATAKKIGILGWYSSNTNWVMSIAFSPDGKTIAISMHSGVIYLWDIATERRIGSLYDRWDAKRSRSDTVSEIMFSSDGETLISCNWDSKIRLWNINKRFKITPYPTIVSPAIGEQFTISIESDIGPNLSVSKMIIRFYKESLRYVKTTNGDLVKPTDTIETRLLPTTFDRIELKARFLEGKGTLANITFEVIDLRASQITISDVNFYVARTPPYWTYYTRIEPPQFPSSAVVSINPSTVLSPAIGEQLVFNVDIADGQNVARSELTLDFDQSALKHISSSEGNYFSEGVGNGNGTLERIIFEVLDVKDSTVGISGYLVAPTGFRYIPTFESAEIIEPLLGDVNRDGTVSILDLVQVASSIGQEVSGGNPADVNEDGVINIIDLVTVAGAINEEAAAPARWSPELQGVFTSDQVQKWLSQAQDLAMTDAISQRGIRFLENLLVSLTPKETALLPNYPNPFNPETWIPYQLSQSADVNISIYTADGAVVRTLAVGHQPKGIYHDKTRAAYWDGKNEVGDAVASGVYFYTLTAGKFKSTRRMLILK